MSDPVVFGLSAALGWGAADFIARFTGRALGHRMALLGMLGASAVIFTAVVWQSDVSLSEALGGDLGGWWLLLGSGVGLMAATLLLYRGLAQGPVTIVAPIVGSYPAFSLLIGAFLGVLPSLAQFGAMLIVMAGVAVVAACVWRSPNARTGSWLLATPVIGLALMSAVGFAVTLTLAQQAIALYGELQSVWVMRMVAFAAIALLFIFQRTPPVAPTRWWPVLVTQGMLDGGAYLAILYGGAGVSGQVTIVIGSCFSAVTVILARIILREAMTLWQWFGVIAIVSGVALLSWLQ